jgi:hypothetical protein
MEKLTVINPIMPPEIEATINAIRLVRESRFLATERGYQGAFYCELRSQLAGKLTNHRILEMEYQKSFRHGLFQRPDILFHIPAEISLEPPNKNNYAVWALKHSGSRNEAIIDFDKLDEMFDTLDYPLGIFINIASPQTHLEHYNGSFKGRIHAFAVPGVNDSTILHSYFEDSQLVGIPLPLNPGG